MSDHRIRVATEADFDEVMAIGDVYKGTDYLRYRYHSFIADPNVTSYVYTVGDEIVGFCSTLLVDDGMTLLIRGSRIKSGHRGQGIYGKLTKHVYKEYRKITTLKYESFTTSNQELEKSYSLLLKRSFLSYRFKVEELAIVAPPSVTNIKEVTTEDMTSLFAAKELHETLFPGGKVIIDWVPLRVLPSNIKTILNSSEHTRALQSKNDNSQITLLTVGTSLPCELGVRYIMDVFGNDVAKLRQHIMCHLDHVTKLTRDAIVFQITLDPSVEKTACDMLQTLGISDCVKTLTLINFERPFQ